MRQGEEWDGATAEVLRVLEEWGMESRMIWFRELHRITDIDKGLLRNILNGLKKSRELTEHKGPNSRIYLCLRKHRVRCSDALYRAGNAGKKGSKGQKGRRRQRRS